MTTLTPTQKADLMAAAKVYHERKNDVVLRLSREDWATVIKALERDSKTAGILKRAVQD